MANETTPEVYQLHAWIRQISPMIWRRLLVRSDSTLANLHDMLQIAFGWTDFHLHRFRIHGRDYGVHRVGGLGFWGPTIIGTETYCKPFECPLRQRSGFASFL
jgi:Plasmid pRiA4b ORF-3-like protein